MADWRRKIVLAYLRSLPEQALADFRQWGRRIFWRDAPEGSQGLDLVSEVEAAIREVGYWEAHEEWRISTVTSMRVEPVERHGKRWYRVSVKCDAEMLCDCPTVERAVEFVGVLRGLQADLYWALGWPSWAAKDKLEP